MTGSLPSVLGNLNSLKSLGIAGGSFTGTLPTELGLVTEMQRLDFGKKF